jgi:hypothetical protein
VIRLELVTAGSLPDWPAAWPDALAQEAGTSLTLDPDTFAADPADEALLTVVTPETGDALVLRPVVLAPGVAAEAGIVLVDDAVVVLGVAVIGTAFVTVVMQRYGDPMVAARMQDAIERGVASRFSAVRSWAWTLGALLARAVPQTAAEADCATQVAAAAAVSNLSPRSVHVFACAEGAALFVAAGGAVTETSSGPGLPRIVLVSTFANTAGGTLGIYTTEVAVHNIGRSVVAARPAGLSAFPVPPGGTWSGSLVYSAEQRRSPQLFVSVPGGMSVPLLVSPPPLN